MERKPSVFSEPSSSRRFCVIRKPPQSGSASTRSLTSPRRQRALSNSRSEKDPLRSCLGKPTNEVSPTTSETVGSKTRRGLEMRDSHFSKPVETVYQPITDSRASLQSPLHSIMNTSEPLARSSPEGSRKALIIKPTISVVPPTSVSFHSTMPSAKVHVDAPLESRIFESAFLDPKVKSFREKDRTTSIPDSSFTLIDFGASTAFQRSKAATPSLSKSPAASSCAASPYHVCGATSSPMSTPSRSFLNEMCKLCCIEYEYRLRLYRQWLQLVNKYYIFKHIVLEVHLLKRQQVQNYLPRLQQRLREYWTRLLQNSMEMHLLWALEVYQNAYTMSASDCASPPRSPQVVEDLCICCRAIQKNMVEFTAITGRLEAESCVLKVLFPASSCTTPCRFEEKHHSPSGQHDHHVPRHLLPRDEVGHSVNPLKPIQEDEEQASIALQRLLYDNASLNDCPIPYHLFLPSPDPCWPSLMRFARHWTVYLSIFNPTLQKNFRMTCAVKQLEKLEEQGRASLTESFLEALQILSSVPAHHLRADVPFRCNIITLNMAPPFDTNAVTYSTESLPKAPPQTYMSQSLENSLLLLQLDNNSSMRERAASVNTGSQMNRMLMNISVNPVMDTGTLRKDPPVLQSMEACCFSSLTNLDSGRESLVDAALDASLLYTSLTNSMPASLNKYAGDSVGGRSKLCSRANHLAKYGRFDDGQLHSHAVDSSEDWEGSKRNLNWVSVAFSFSLSIDQQNANGLGQSRTGLGSQFFHSSVTRSFPQSTHTPYNCIGSTALERSGYIIQHVEKVARETEECRERFHRSILYKSTRFLRTRILTKGMMKHALQGSRGIALARAPPKVRLLWSQLEEEKMLLVHQYTLQLECELMEFQSAAVMLKEVTLHRLFLNELAREIDMASLFSRSHSGGPRSSFSSVRGTSSYMSPVTSHRLMPARAVPTVDSGLERRPSAFVSRRHLHNGVPAVASGSEASAPPPEMALRYAVPFSSPVTPLLSGSSSTKRSEVSNARYGKSNNLIVEDHRHLHSSHHTNTGFLRSQEASENVHLGNFSRASNITGSQDNMGLAVGGASLGGASDVVLDPRVVGMKSRVIACLLGEDNPKGHFWGYRPSIPAGRLAWKAALGVMHQLSREIKTYVQEHASNSSGESLNTPSVDVPHLTLRYIECTNGDLYAGGWLKEERHGLGVYSFGQIGFSYAGGWKNNTPHGDGVLLRVSLESSTSISLDSKSGPSDRSAASSEVEQALEDLAQSSFDSLRVLIEQLRVRHEQGGGNHRNGTFTVADRSRRPAIHLLFGHWANGSLASVTAVFSSLSKA